MRGPLELEVLLDVDRDRSTPLHAQIERGLREGIRAGRLLPGVRLPSSRALATRLGVSRGVVVEAYDQLVAEGYLATGHGSHTRVADRAVPVARPPRRAEAPAADAPPMPRFDFHPGLPDVGAFPRAQWMRSLRRASADMPHAALGYGDVRGAAALREALASYLGRARGAVADPRSVLISNGQVQGLALACRALRARGVTRMAMEDPCFFVHRMVVEHCGLEPVPVPVDEDGMRVEQLHGSGAGGALLTPAHQSPTGVVLAAPRRRELLAWAEEEDAVVIEDDYDAEFRYDREPVGALQGLAPERVVYMGSASKTLAPALRLAWSVLPRDLAGAVRSEKMLDDMGSPTLDQLALADFLERGELDRHLRRMRPRYRARRAALEAALERHMPGTRLHGVTAGLYAIAQLPEGADEDALVEAAWRRGVGVHPLGPMRFDPAAGPPGLVLGFASQAEGALARGIEQLARAAEEAGDGGASG